MRKIKYIKIPRMYTPNNQHNFQYFFFINNHQNLFRMVDLLIVTIVNFHERVIRLRDTKDISKSKIKKKSN